MGQNKSGCLGMLVEWLLLAAFIVTCCGGCMLPEYRYQCLGWCQAHGYERADYVGSSMEFDVHECWCGERVGADAALAPVPELPAEASGS